MDQEQKTGEKSAASRGVRLGSNNKSADRQAFQSIMFPPGMEESRREVTDQPACFVDLNLDQAVAAIVARWNEAVLRPLFHSTYRNEHTIRYRQEIFRDIERPDIFPLLPEFCEGMRKTRSDLAYARKITYKCHREMVLLRAIAAYCETIVKVLRGFESLDLRSQGLSSFRQYLTEYTSSDRFVTLAADTRNMQSRLSTICYGMLFRGDKVTVREYASELDYATTVLERFARFRQDEDDLRTVPSSPSHASLNHIEEGILDFVGRLFPDQFGSLEEYTRRHADFIDNTLALFDREVSFFLAYLSYIEPLKSSGLLFCYPDVSACDKDTAVSQGFDLPLAKKLVEEKASVVCNDFYLSGAERMIVVSGPNQGGKTTFARMFGQIHFLAGLGCPVPGQQARVFLADELFTHFEREENITNLRGKLEEELVRLRESCRAMTSDSVIILNEIFNSTSLEDQIFLSKKVLTQILASGAIGVCVTFIDALSTLSEGTVSMVSTVVVHDPAARTFKIVRKPADGLAYALSLAEKRGVTYERLRTRVRQ
jgi:DNA mismatch repair protein MutS